MTSHTATITIRVIVAKSGMAGSKAYKTPTLSTSQASGRQGRGTSQDRIAAMIAQPIKVSTKAYLSRFDPDMRVSP